MAITLTIELTDQEQAKLLEIAAVVKPGATPAQIKNWAEKQAKHGLRESVQRLYFDYHNESLNSSWPMEQPPVPPQSP